MSIRVRWDNEKRSILVYEFGRFWSWQELYDAQERAHAMLDATQTVIGIILQMPDTVIIPPRAMAHGRRLMTNTHPNTEVITLVGLNTLSRHLLNALNRLYRRNNLNNIHVLKTFDEARLFIEERLSQAMTRG